MNRFFKKSYLFLRLAKHQVFNTFFGFSSTCRQQPSCSAYTLAQIKKNGTIVGLIQGLWRVVNCRHS
jgi:putative component of membrane protein insertase Oxa1/YidC/SpoIIIJ protein YidD